MKTSYRLLSHSWRRLQMALFIAFSLVRMGAEDLATNDGKVYQDIDIKELDGESITFGHRGVVSRILLKDLPVDVQLRYSPFGLFLELRRVKAELETVKRELAAAQGRTTNSPFAATTFSQTPPSENQRTALSAMEPSRPISGLPALLPDTVVAADEIVLHYKTDSRAAELRYRKKTFRIRGKVARFEEKPFIRKTAVVLEAQAALPRIVCDVPFPEGFRAVYSSNNGQLLVGISGSRREVRLMAIDDWVVFEGKCSGFAGTEISFSQCRRLP